MVASIRIGGSCILAGVGLFVGAAQGGVLFSDNFETAPEISTLAPIPPRPDPIPPDVDADPVAQVGSWWVLDKTTIGVGSLSEQVTNYTAEGPPAVGPHSGSNYLRMQHYQDTEAKAIFTSAQTSDVQLDTWIYVTYVSFRVFMLDTAGEYGNLLSWGEGATGFLTNHNGGFQATSVPYTLDTWQHLIIDFHFGDATYDVSLDGIKESGIPMAFGVGVLPDYDQILFAGGGYPPSYLDDVVIRTPVVASRWNVDSDGDWSNAANWEGGVPNGADAIANFTNAINSAHTVTVDAPQTVGVMSFDNSNSYTLAGSSTLTVDASGSGSIDVISGSHTISAPLALAKSTDINVAQAASTLTLSGDQFSSAGVVITKLGAGTLAAKHVRGDGLTISAGSVQVMAKATANDPAGTSVVKSLAIAGGPTAPTAKLDLTNNALVIDYTGAAGTLVDDVRQYLMNGGIISSSADATRGLGYADNAGLGLSSFAGQTVDADSVLVKYTYLGDTNLDGQVDVIDLGNLATAWQTNSVWAGGDSNYDGFVDVIDLGLLATNWQAGVGSPLGPGSLAQALAAYGLPSVGVPEPAGAVLLIGGIAGLMRSRKQR